MEFFQFPDLPCFPHFHRRCPLSPKKNYLEPSAPFFLVGLQTNHTCLLPFSASVLVMRGQLRKRGKGTLSMPPGEARWPRPQNNDEVLLHSLPALPVPPSPHLLCSYNLAGYRSVTREIPKYPQLHSLYQLSLHPQMRPIIIHLL